MTKRISLLLAVCMGLSVGVMLTACDEKHSHTYETEWSKDATHHWYACEEESCSSTSQKAEHSVDNGVCSVCGYEKSATAAPPVNYEVTAEQFNAAFAFDNVTNVTVQSEGNMNIVNGVQQDVYHSTVYLDGNKVKTVADGVTTYGEIFDTHVYVYSYDAAEEIWTRSTVGVEEHGFVTLDSLREMFEGANFSDFSYEDGYYIGSKDAGEGDEGYTVNFKFQFANGKLISARGQYEVDGFDCYDYLSFSDYNNTTVNIPTEYRGGNTSWNSYFQFDNVTAEKTSILIVDNGGTSRSRNRIMIANGQWLLHRETTYGEPGSSITMYDDVYFDGENVYLDGELNDGLDSENEGFFFNADFSAYESSFTETASGVYTANNIDVYGVFSYSAVTIVITNDRIASVDCRIDYGEFSEEVFYSFTNWDSTVVKAPTPSLDSYFHFENVTFENTITMTYGTREDVITADVLLDGNEWKYTETKRITNGIENEDYSVIYGDGEDVYLDGDKTDIPFKYANGTVEELEYFLLCCKAYLLESDDNGVFEYNGSILCMTFEDYDKNGDWVKWTVVYSYAKVTVEEGLLSSVEYVKTATTATGDRVTYKFEYAFTDWNETVIAR